MVLRSIVGLARQGRSCVFELNLSTRFVDASSTGAFAAIFSCSIVAIGSRHRFL